MMRAVSSKCSVVMGALLSGVIFACSPEATDKRGRTLDSSTGAEPGTGGRGVSSQGGAMMAANGGSGGGSGGMGTGGMGMGGRGGAGGAGGAGRGGSSGSDARPDVAEVRPPDVRPPVDAGPPPTFTELYTNYFSKKASTTVIGCAGVPVPLMINGRRLTPAEKKAAEAVACHLVNHEGFICSNKEDCFDGISIRADACDDDTDNCPIIAILDSKTMPKGSNRKMAKADLDKIRAWIVAGAKDN